MFYGQQANGWWQQESSASFTTSFEFHVYYYCYYYFGGCLVDVGTTSVTKIIASSWLSMFGGQASSSYVRRTHMYVRVYDVPCMRYRELNSQKVWICLSSMKLFGSKALMCSCRIRVCQCWIELSFRTSDLVISANYSLRGPATLSVLSPLQSGTGMCCSGFEFWHYSRNVLPAIPSLARKTATIITTATTAATVTDKEISSEFLIYIYSRLCINLKLKVIFDGGTLPFPLSASSAPSECA